MPPPLAGSCPPGSTSGPAAAAAQPALRGLDGIMTVVDQLAGVPIPASAWEPLVLAGRVADYQPAMLDELMATGEVSGPAPARCPATTAG